MPPKKSAAAAGQKRSRSSASAAPDAPPPSAEKKGAKKETAAPKSTTSANKKGATAAAASTPAPAATGKEANIPLITAFKKLMLYEGKAGEKWASVAYAKVVKVLMAHPTAITSSADVAKKDGVGKASIGKIDEFLSTGTIKKLEEHEGNYGELDESEIGIVSNSAFAEVKPKPTPAAVIKKIKAAKDNFEDMSTDNLKTLLRTNLQVTTGTKDELAQRCAEGLVLGAVPTCPLCYAGKLRFEMKTGIYKCPGYMDDTDYKPCLFKGTDVTRNPWNNV